MSLKENMQTNSVERGCDRLIPFINRSRKKIHKDVIRKENNLNVANGRDAALHCPKPDPVRDNPSPRSHPSHFLVHPIVRNLLKGKRFLNQMD